MKRTKKILTALFCGALIVALLLVVLFEGGLLAEGLMAGVQPFEFYAAMLMELLTLALIVLALRLFKINKVRASLLAGKAEALLKWGMLRLSMLGGLLVANTACYYLTMAPTFGYLGIITLLCLPFVYPSMDRCLTETEA